LTLNIKTQLIGNVEISQTPVRCPFCGSIKTRRETDFGTTLAYAQFYCLACRTPFEWIKWENETSAKDLPTFLFPEKNAEGLTVE
jgi:hypothetical protein